MELKDRPMEIQDEHLDSKRKRLRDVESGLSREERALELARSIRHRLVGAPPELQGEAAHKYVDEEVAKLLPEAVKVLTYRLRYGNPDQRMDAAERAFDMSGHGRKTGEGGATAPIVLVNVQAGVQAGQGKIKPFSVEAGAQVLPANSTVINGQVVNAEGPTT